MEEEEEEEELNLVRAERVWKIYRLNASGIMFNHKTIHRDNRLKKGREKTKPEEMRFVDHFIAVQL